MSELPEPTAEEQSRKRPREEEGAEAESVEEVKTTASSLSDDGISSIGQDDESRQTEQPVQPPPRNYAMPPFVPDQKAYEL